jgi:hypothetical protein
MRLEGCIRVNSEGEGKKPSAIVSNKRKNTQVGRIVCSCQTDICWYARSLSNFIIDSTGPVPFRCASRGWRPWNAWEISLACSLQAITLRPNQDVHIADERFELNRKRAGGQDASTATRSFLSPCRHAQLCAATPCDHLRLNRQGYMFTDRLWTKIRSTRTAHRAAKQSERYQYQIRIDCSCVSQRLAARSTCGSG